MTYRLNCHLDLTIKRNHRNGPDSFEKKGRRFLLKLFAVWAHAGHEGSKA
jgi:hypothetical protein